jgi:hypothetical protein
MALHDLVSESLEIMCPSLSNLNSRASPALAWRVGPSGPTTLRPATVRPTNSFSNACVPAVKK